MDHILIDWLRGRVTSEMQRTAEEWHGGHHSCMYKMYESCLKEDVDLTVSDYKNLAAEAAEALGELTPDFDYHRAPLEEIAELGRDAKRAEALLKRLKKDAQDLSALGIEPHKIIRLVEEAAKEPEQASKNVVRFTS